MCERKMTFGGICAALAICVGLTGAYAADTVIGQIEVKNGTAGAAGAAGADGLSAYQIWLNNNHTGSEADFLASLVGATGAAGQDGAPGCATTITKSKVGGITTLTAKDCNNNTVWTETVEDGADGTTPISCEATITMSDKDTSTGCYTISTQKRKANAAGTACENDGSAISKQVCDGTNGTNGTNCTPTFTSSHDATAKKTVLSISGCGTTSTVDIPDGEDGQDGKTPISCEATITMSDKDTSTGCYTISTQKRKANAAGTACENDGSAISKQVCDGATGAPGTNGTNCEPTFSSAHDATNKKTVVTISGCGSTSTVDIPDGQDGNDGTPGTNGVGICDNVANPATAVKTYTKTYTAPTSTKPGYVTLEQTMCNDSTNTTNYQDTCTPIHSTNKDICSGNGGTYMECTRQDTGAAYNICKAITTQNASAISTAISAAQTAAETAQNTADNKVDTTTFTSYQTTVASTYANKDDVYNKTQVDSAISTATANKITAAEVDNKITAATTGLANKTYVDNAVANKVTSSDVNNAISTALEDYSTTAQMNSALANKADTSALSSYLQTADLGTALKDNSLKTDLASAVGASGALTGYLTSADASSTYATQTALNTADGKITALETTVGDSNSGLVKQVATNTSTIGNASSGLVKDVADAKTSAANAVSTANTASTNATQAKQDAASAVTTAGEAKTTAQSASTGVSTLNTAVYGRADGTETTSGLVSIVGKTASTGLRGSVATNTSNISRNTTNIGNLDTTVSGHTTSIGNLQTSVSNNTTTLSSLSNRLNGNCSGGSSESGKTGTKGSTGSDSGSSSASTGDHGEVCGMSIEERIAAIEARLSAANL